MTTSLTENQLTEIKKSLENSLFLVERGLRHYSSTSKRTPVSDLVKNSLDNNTESVYYKHPEFLFHFQCFETSFEVVQKNGVFSVRVFDFIPTRSIPLTIPREITLCLDPLKIVRITNSSEIATLPQSYFDQFRHQLDYGNFDKLDPAINLWKTFIEMFLNVEELPF